MSARFTELTTMVGSMEQDFVKFYDGKVSKAAPAVRKNLRALKLWIKEVSKEVSTVKGARKAERKAAKAAALAAAPAETAPAPATGTPA